MSWNTLAQPSLIVGIVGELGDDRTPRAEGTNARRRSMMDGSAERYSIHRALKQALLRIRSIARDEDERNAVFDSDRDMALGMPWRWYDSYRAITGQTGAGVEGLPASRLEYDLPRLEPFRVMHIEIALQRSGAAQREMNLLA